MESLSWEDDSDGDIIAGYYFNSSTHLYKLENSESTLNQIIAQTNRSASQEVRDFLDADLNSAQGSIEIKHLDCLGCGSVVPGDNQSNSLVDTLNDTTRTLFSPVEGVDNEHSELYVIPWSIVILWCFLYGGISAAALIGNTLVMWVVAISRTMRTVTNMFIANLALADFIIGLFTIPFQFQAALLQRWNLPDFMCAFCPFVQVLSVNVSVFTLSAIAVDRYRAVLSPLSPRVSKRKATWAIVTIWTMSILIALPTELDYKVTLYNDTEKGEIKPFCSNAGLSVTFRMYYSLSLLVIQYILPLIILTVAYAHMTAILWGTTVPGNKEESRDAVVLRNKKKVIKMLTIVVLIFGICWLPLRSYDVLQIFFPSINEFKYINITWFCFHWLAMSNSCCNPFIYAIYNDKFQREFRARLGCICNRNRNEDPDGLNGSYAEGSYVDGGKIRASFRFKNNLSVRYNHKNVYNNEETPQMMTTEFNQGEFRSSIKYPKTSRQNSSRCNRQSQEGRKINKSSRNADPQHSPLEQNNSQTFKFDPSGADKLAYHHTIAINNEDAANNLRKENIVASNKTFSHQPVKSIKNDNDHASAHSPVAATQIAVVCPNSGSSANSTMVTITIVTNDGVCQL